MKRKIFTLFFCMLSMSSLLTAQVWEEQNAAIALQSVPEFVIAPNANDLWTFAHELAFDSVGLYYYSTEHNYSVSRSTDGGEIWESLDFPHTEPGYFSNLCALDGNIAWISYADYAEGNKVLKTTDGGESWASQPIGITTFINLVHFFDASHGVAMGDPDAEGFEIYTTTDGGASWIRTKSVPLNLTDEYAFGGVFDVIGSSIWFRTNANRIYHSSDRGNTWTVMNGYATTEYHSITGVDHSGVYSGYTEIDPTSGYPTTTLYRSTDHGITWEQTTPPFIGWWILDIELIPGTETLIAQFNLSYLVAPTETRISYDHGVTWITIDDTSRVMYMEFLDASTGFSGGWQPLDDLSPVKVHKYTGSPLTGLFDPKLLDIEVSISPNPTSDFIDITMTADAPEDYVILLNDLSGRLIAKYQFNAVSDIHHRLDMKSLVSGTYMLTITSQDGVLTEKIVRQ